MTYYLNFLAENWYMIVLAICAIILLILKIIEFIGFPTEKKLEEIKTRLLSFVTEAELALGEKTNQLKLARVYDRFCEAYPYVAKWISWDHFYELVEDVLPTMRKILKEKEGE